MTYHAINLSGTRYMGDVGSNKFLLVTDSFIISAAAYFRLMAG